MLVRSSSIFTSSRLRTISYSPLCFTKRVGVSSVSLYNSKVNLISSSVSGFAAFRAMKISSAIALNTDNPYCCCGSSSMTVNCLPTIINTLQSPMTVILTPPGWLVTIIMHGPARPFTSWKVSKKTSKHTKSFLTILLIIWFDDCSHIKIRCHILKIESIHFQHK